MQTTSSAHLMKHGREGIPEADAKRHPEPFGELERAIISDVIRSAGVLMDSYRAGKGRDGGHREARAEYLAHLGRLSGLRPEIPLWRLELMVLPEDLRSLEAGIFGLPATRVPISPGDVWKNEPLEQMLKVHAGSETRHLVRHLSLLLDRFVESGMRLSDIADFYRPSVARLIAAGGPGTPQYHYELIANARFLTQIAAPMLLTQNASLLNMSLHKHRCTKTGDALGESDPAKRHSYIREKKQAPAVARIRVGQTALSRLGLEAGSDEVVDSLSQKWGLPLPEQLGPEWQMPTKDSLAPHLTFNIFSGKETSYSHPDLPGMEFSPAECDEAFGLVITAAERIAAGAAPGEESITALDLLSQSDEFRGACEHGDGRLQLRWGLAVLTIFQRTEALMVDKPETDRLEAFRIASEDFRMATNMVAQYRAERDTPAQDQSMVPLSIRKMLKAGNEQQDTPPFDLALQVIDEKRRKRQSFTTLVPPGSLNDPQPGPAPQRAEAEAQPAPSGAVSDVAPAGRGEVEGTEPGDMRQPPLPADLVDAEASRFPSERPTLVMPTIPPAISGMIPIQNVAMDGDLEDALPPLTDEHSAAVRHLSRYIAHCMIYGFSEAQMPVFLRSAHAELVGPRSVKATRLVMREIRSDAPASEHSAAHEPFEQEGYLVRAGDIITAVDRLVRGTDFSALSSRPAPRAEEAPVPLPPGHEEEQRLLREAESAAVQAHAPAAEKPGLVLPVENGVLDDRLEAVLPPKTNARSRYVRHVSRILAYYMIYGVDDGNVHDQYLPAVCALRGPAVTHRVPVKYATGREGKEGEVKEIPGFDFVPAEVVRAAESIVDSCDISKVTTPTEYLLERSREAVAAEASAREASDRELGRKLGELMHHEKELVAGTVGAQSCDAEALRGFLEMHPGRRELAMAAYVNSRWAEQDWRSAVERSRAAAASVYRTLSIQPAAESERAEAVHDPSVLTPIQRSVVASLFSMDPSAVQQIHIEGFAAWVSGDRARIGAFLDRFFVEPERLVLLAQKMVVPNSRFNPDEQALLAWLYDKPFERITAKEAHNAPRATECARAMQGIRNFWLHTPQAERMRLWRTDDLLSAGELAHKLRFLKGSRLSVDELRTISTMLGRRVTDGSQLTEHDMSRISAAMVQHTESVGEMVRKVRADPGITLGAEELAALSVHVGRQISGAAELTGADLDHILQVSQQRASRRRQDEKKGEEKYYYAELVRIAMLGHAAHPSSLLVAARREGEFLAMLDSLGIPHERAVGRMDPSSGLSRPKRKNGKYYETNDDSISGAVVELPDGRKVALDLVCDGMGGMDQGASGKFPNGCIASNRAKDAFDAMAMAGWIRTPEEARKAIIVADLAVTMEQLHMKVEFDKPAAAIGPLEFEAQRFLQQNMMGTTMVVGMQDGRKFWGIHCGDSEWKVLRGDAIAYEAVGHSFEYLILTQYGITLAEHYRNQFAPVARQQLMDAWTASPEHAAALARNDPAWLAEFERQVEQALGSMVAESVSRSKSIVSAGLAQNTQFVHINNLDSGYEPIYLRDGDITIVVSDGVTVPVCNHEFRTLIDMAGGDLERARELAIETSENRRDRGPHQTMCSCQSREGKNDDKSITMREAASGFRDGAIKAALQADPRGFATASERLSMLSMCANGQIGQPAVREAIDLFIEAAESAPSQTRNDTYTVAVATIFDMISQRPERDELLDYVAPRLGSWSGLLMKKLMKSPDFSPRKAAMLEIVRRSVDAENLAALRGAPNKELASAVSAILGGQPAKQDAGAEQAHPQPIFRSQRSESGRQLGPLETRYLDAYLIDLHESAIVQETAAKLRVLPRDLEIMVFNVYSDFNPQVAVDPHATVEGQNLISEVWMNLATGDAKSILTASYLIYRMRETSVEQGDVGKFLDVMWRSVRSMESTTAYSRRFYNEALRLTKEYRPDDPRGA